MNYSVTMIGFQHPLTDKKNTYFYISLNSGITLQAKKGLCNETIKKAEMLPVFVDFWEIENDPDWPL